MTKQPHVFVWKGRQYKGAASVRKTVKRKEAEARAETTPHERTRAHREGRCEYGQHAR
jgi:hypothetical protein